MADPLSAHHKNITRIDHPARRTHGYNVRIAWKSQKYGKFFSDGNYRDQQAALAAAIAWRNRIERQIGKPRTEQQVVGIHPRNNTGVVGVRRRMRGKVEVFEATWIVQRDDGQQRRTTCFSIARHGEQKAFKLAFRARKHGERQRWGAPQIRKSRSPMTGR